MIMSSRCSDIGVNLFNDLLVPSGAPLLSPKTKYEKNRAFVRNNMASKVSQDSKVEFQLSSFDVKKYNDRICPSKLNFEMINKQRIQQNEFSMVSPLNLQ